MAESLPTSVSAFSHRRARADSTTSFSFYQDEDELQEAGEALALESGGARLSVDDIDELPFDDDLEEPDDSTDMERNSAYGEDVFLRRTSTQSRGSIRSRLLRRDSGVSAGSGYGANRHSQKVYMVNEDLYIVIAGFRTSPVGLALYALLCLLTFGLAWLLFRWLPRWHIKLVGKPSPLRDCQWVVVENQWNEMAILDVDSRPYGRSLSTVFGTPGKMDSYLLVDEDQDPILRDLRMISYRYVRLFFHPNRDKFLLGTGWKDPRWSNVREIRAGIDSEEKTHRDVVFGDNLIDIEEKSWFQLLVDEVGSWPKDKWTELAN
jgi:cation-transporting ATPase 13A3/4/5